MSAMSIEPRTRRIRPAPRLRYDPPDGMLVTRASAVHVEWAVLSPGGVSHRIVGAILRWNHMGGTFERPVIGWLTACNWQKNQLYPVTTRTATCIRCLRAEARARGIEAIVPTHAATSGLVVPADQFERSGPGRAPHPERVQEPTLETGCEVGGGECVIKLGLGLLHDAVEPDDRLDRVLRGSGKVQDGGDTSG